MSRNMAGAWRHAFAGLASAYRQERHMRVHALGAYVAVCATILARPSAAGSAAVALAIGAVVSLELMNSALERAVDRVGPELHPLSRDAKDMAAAAVVVAAAAAIAVALAVLVPRADALVRHFLAWPTWLEAGAAGGAVALAVLAAWPARRG